MKEKRPFTSIRRPLFAEGRMAVLLMTFMTMFMSMQVAWAQGNYGYTLPPDWEKACITDVGVVVSDVELYLRKDMLTQKIDTMLFFSEPEVLWKSDAVNVYDSISVDHAMQPRRNARRQALNDDGRYQWGNLMEEDSKLLDFHYYVFRFEYPSVDANGDAIMLSGIAACPTPSGASKVNNIITGWSLQADNRRERHHARGHALCRREGNRACGGNLSISWTTKIIRYSTRKAKRYASIRSSSSGKIVWEEKVHSLCLPYNVALSGNCSLYQLGASL